MLSGTDLLNLYKEEKAIVIGGPEVRTGLEYFPSFNKWKVDYTREYLETHETVSEEEADRIMDKVVADAEAELERMQMSDTVIIPASRSGRITVEAPRFWYHTMHWRSLNEDGSLSGYPVRPKEVELLDLFPKAEDDKVVYIAPNPLPGDFVIKIDISSFTDRVRYTGQSEGYGIIKGNVPAEAITVIKHESEPEDTMTTATATATKPKTKAKKAATKKPGVKKSTAKKAAATTSKKTLARRVFKRHYAKIERGTMKRGELLQKMMEQTDVTYNGASTYYQQFKAELEG